MRLSLLKCHSMVNDFVLIDESGSTIFEEDQRGPVARILSDRNGTVGSDGVLYVLQSDHADVRMRMFNPDGSEPEISGNGLRCVGRYACEKLNRSSVNIETMRGLLKATHVADIFPGVWTTKIEVGPISLLACDLPMVTESSQCIEERIDSLSHHRTFTAVAVPNPHLISFVDVINESELLEVGTKTESIPSILPNRANVSFCQILRKNEIFVRTYERGAGITESCGSGLAASAVAACQLGFATFGADISMYTKSGLAKCSVHARPRAGLLVEQVSNVTFVYTGIIDIDTKIWKLGSVMNGHLRFDEVENYGKFEESVANVRRKLMQVR